MACWRECKEKWLCDGLFVYYCDGLFLYKYFQHLLMSFEELSLRLNDPFALVGGCINNREVPPDVIFRLYELTLRLWKNGANSAVKCIRRLLWAWTYVEFGWVASDPEWPRARCCKFQPADDVVFVFVFVLSLCPSRNRKRVRIRLTHTCSYS